jgi:DNA-binding transcriptional regulator WhiA
VKHFSGDAKDEIAAVRFVCARCPATFLNALARFSSAKPLRGDAPRVVLTERSAVARAALRAARAAGIELHASHKTSERFRSHSEIVVGGASPAAAFKGAPVRRCCRAAWLRGAFLACGSVTDPRRSYHLEFFCRRDDDARALTQALTAIDVDAGVTRRRGRPLVYLKGATAVAELLGHLGAARAVLELDDVLAMRSTKNAIRRRVNSEAANAARAAASSAHQLDVARRVVNRLGLDRLSPAMREAARLRIAHPDRTLAELAKRARPPVTKAAMAYRFRALSGLSRSRA